jgi:chromosome partitioning protein
MNMRKIAFINEKGGSCKTTLSVNIASYLAGRAGRRVLLLDMDPQGQSGKALGIDVKSSKTTTMELLMNPAVGVADAVQATRIEGLDVVVSNKSLIDFPVAAAASEDRAEKLHQKLKAVRKYDYIIFDTPPSLGLLTLNVMLAAQEIVIPVNLTFLALDGCAEIVETVNTVKEQYNRPSLRITLVVPVLYRNTRLANAILHNLGEFFGDKLSKTVIGFNVTVDEAQSKGLTIWEYAPNSPGAVAFEALAREIHPKD